LGFSSSSSLSLSAQHADNIVPNPGRNILINNKNPATPGFLTGTRPSMQHMAYSRSPSSCLSLSFLGRLSNYLSNSGYVVDGGYAFSCANLTNSRTLGAFD
jgi:hypothetical protein